LNWSINFLVSLFTAATPILKVPFFSASLIIFTIGFSLPNFTKLASTQFGESCLVLFPLSLAALLFNFLFKLEK